MYIDKLSAKQIEQVFNLIVKINSRFSYVFDMDWSFTMDIILNDKNWNNSKDYDFICNTFIEPFHCDKDHQCGWYSLLVTYVKLINLLYKIGSEIEVDWREYIRNYLNLEELSWKMAIKAPKGMFPWDDPWWIIHRYPYATKREILIIAFKTINAFESVFHYQWEKTRDLFHSEKDSRYIYDSHNFMGTMHHTIREKWEDVNTFFSYFVRLNKELQKIDLAYDLDPDFDPNGEIYEKRKVPFTYKCKENSHQFLKILWTRSLSSYFEKSKKPRHKPQRLHHMICKNVEIPPSQTT